MKALKTWLKTLKISDIDLELMKTAFTHRSIRGLGYKVNDYQRLEFLGDSVIDIIVSDKLYNMGQYPEGDLTELRSLLVREAPLAKLFDSIKMSSLVKRTGVTLSTKMKSDVIEAFFAVIYLDKGIKKCRKVWDLMMNKTSIEEEVINNYLNNEKEGLKELLPEQIEERGNLREYYTLLKINTNQNAKNVLQQLFQKIYRAPHPLPNYKIFHIEGPDNAVTFTVKLNESLSVNEKIYDLKVMGVASKIKNAQIRAAEKACDILYLPYNKI